MRIYEAFIDKIKTEGGVNVIYFADDALEIYISFKTLLKFIDEYINIVDKSNVPIIGIDYQSDKPFFAFSTSVSLNLKKCYIYNTYVGNSDGSDKEGIAKFIPFTSFNSPDDNLNTILNLQTASELKAGQDEDSKYSMYPTIGNINNIYLSIGRLSEILFKDSDNSESKSSVQRYLQIVCDEVGKALGSLNDFQAIVDEDTNVLTIIDFNQKRIKGLRNTSSATTIIKAQGLGSFVTGISAQSSITPEIATAISIGAQANGNQLGQESTTFSRLSKGYIDRLYTEKKVRNSEDLSKIKLNEKNNTTFSENKKAYIKLIENQKETGQQKIALESKNVNIENVPVELYKALLGKFTDSDQASTTFIPVKLDITLAGISGIKIFQRFNISSDVLPYTYSDNFDFIVLGVSHQIDNNGKWLTKISAITILKET